MGGGLIQLLAYGAENQYLMGNPQITFWKVVYRRHTNFSMEHIEVLFNGKQELSYDSTTILKAKIPRHGDLINKMYFKCIVPGWKCGTNYKLRMIKNVGTSMIKTAKLFIGGQLIDILYGEWLYIYNDLFQGADKRTAYDAMTGNNSDRYSIGGVNGDDYPDDRGWDDLTLTITNSNTKTIDIDSVYIQQDYTTITLGTTGQTVYTLYPSVYVKTTSDHGLSVGDTIISSGWSDTNSNSIGNATDVKITYVSDDVFVFKTSDDVTADTSQTDIPSEITTLSSSVETSDAGEFALLTGGTVKYYVDYSDRIESGAIQPRSVQYPWPITVPLDFWFTKNPGLSLPLIALQYHDVEIELELRPIEELYVIKDTDTSSLYYNKYIKPQSTNSDHRFENFGITRNFLFDLGTESRCDSQKTGWGLTPTLEIKYIYLDREERKVFANIEHEYLIEQVSRQEITGIVGEKVFEVELYHPIKEIIIVSQRDDISSKNEWTNFTNQESILQNNNQSVGDNKWNKMVYTPIGAGIISDHKNYSKKMFNDIVVTLGIKINGLQRQSARYYNYWKYLQPYESHHTKNDTRGIYVYSFCLNNNSYQPNGSMNASRIKKVEFEVKTREPFKYSELLDQVNFPSPDSNSNNDYVWKYNFIVYSINYNILRISSGMGGLAFAN